MRAQPTDASMVLQVLPCTATPGLRLITGGEKPSHPCSVGVALCQGLHWGNAMDNALMGRAVRFGRGRSFGRLVGLVDYHGADLPW